MTNPTSELSKERSLFNSAPSSNESSASILLRRASELINQIYVERDLEHIATKLSEENDRLLLKSCLAYKNVFEKLVRDYEVLKIKLARILLQEGTPQDYNKDFLPLIVDCSTSFWFKVGEAWHHNKSYFATEAALHLLISQPKDTIVSLINGLAARTIEQPQTDQCSFIGHLYQHLISKISSKNLSPLFNLTKDAWKLLSVNLKDFQGNNYLWWHIIKALKSPQTQGEKDILIILSTWVIKSYVNEEQRLIEILELLTCEQISALSWQLFPQEMTLFFALKTKMLALHADEICSIGSHNSARTTASLYWRLGVHAHLPLIEILEGSIDNKKPPNLLLHAILDILFTNLHSKELLLWPTPMIMRHLKRKWSHKNQIAFLNTLPPSLANEAFDIWKTSSSWDENDFPFERMIDINENPGHIASWASRGSYAESEYLQGGDHNLYTFNPKTILDSLKSFEKHPWKFWVALPEFNTRDLIEFGKMTNLKGYIGKPIRIHFPVCFAILDWYCKQNSKASKESWRRSYASKEQVLKDSEFTRIVRGI